MSEERPESTTVSVCAVGELMVDVAIAGAGHGARVRLSPGGSAPNVAAWAASLGAEATVVGRVGDDFAGRALRETLERRGIRASLGVDEAAPTGTFALVDGEIRADPGANAHLGPGHLPAELAADVVVVSGYLHADAVEAALARARAAWVTLLPGRLDALPDGANAVLANEAEARHLTGLAADEAAHRLAERFRLACVTRGPLGAVAVLDGQVGHAQPPRPSPGSALGAGDAFAAGLLVALARGALLGAALAEGARCGALAAAVPGGWPRV